MPDSANESEAAFSTRLLAWYDQHGRKDLPWKRARSAYATWVSEIMLQQTQVTTVIPYFQRFVARFPDVAALADAPLDDVLHLWSGLGYYARARNLHAAAQRIRDEHDRELPVTFDDLAALPGIGRSTAGAVLALTHGQRHAILDGNVKRVLARHAAVKGWPGRSAVARQLWALAEARTPHERIADYTQAIMDLGATLCARSRPRCDLCPVIADCIAQREGRQSQLPERKPRRAKPLRNTCMLMLCQGDEVLLERRPPTGIWGGLWSLPEFDDAGAAARWCRDHVGVDGKDMDALAVLRHSFSHYDLDITPLLLRAKNPAGSVMEGGRYLWYNEATHDLGLAAPVRRLIERVNELEERA